MLGLFTAGLLSLGAARHATIDSLKGGDEPAAAQLAAIATATGGNLAVNVVARGNVHSLNLQDSTARLEDLFKTLDYDLGAVATGNSHVPPVYVASLPADLAGLSVVDRRKSVFVRTMLPLVLAANEDIREERRRIIAIRTDLEAGRPVPPASQAWLTGVMNRYKIKPQKFADGLTANVVEELLVKVDVIPPSLALAQAIVESGWGTSRFAREGNAIFGQWTWSSRHDGMVPGSRDDGKTHRIRAFDTLQGSVASYMLNLNRHYAYAGFRRLRHDLREQGKTPTGVELAAELSRYSTKREGYVRLLRGLIRTNALAGLDTSKLADGVTVSRVDVADRGI